jgi:hypothetical protein
VEAFNKEKRSQTHEEFLLILPLFQKLIQTQEDTTGSYDILEEMISLRASFLLDRVFEGMHMDFNKALNLLRSNNELTTLQEKEERDILVAAIDNLVDFAAAEEFTLMKELPNDIDTEHPELYENICKKYNEVYATQENGDVFHAATMAAWWITVPQDTLVSYMTQGDERVRAWHLSMEGLTFPKHKFPEALIPPIEHGCRCYLMTEGSMPSIHASLKRDVDYQKKVNPVFTGSLACKGKIFSQSHSYFKIALPDKIETIVKRIKNKFYI